MIVGGGESAACAVASLRESNCADPIVWLGEEPPYERPPLSKDFLSGRIAAPPPVAQDVLADPKIDHRFDQRVGAIDRPSQRIMLDGGGTLPYSRLLLATGARARHLSFVGARAERWRTLRRLEDACALQLLLGAGRRIVIIGAGLIGLEVAAAAAAAGASVTVIESRERVLARVLPPELGAMIEERHRIAGVVFHFETGIASVDGAEDGERILLHSGERIVADTILVAIGSEPSVELAADCGLAVANGIVVDSHLRTMDPTIWASGDCCAFPLPLAGGRHVRLESWQAARTLGEIAGRNMAGVAQHIDLVPWFWSDQYELGIQGAGFIDGTSRDIRHDAGNGSVLTFHLDAEGRMVGASGVGPNTSIAKSIKRAREIIARRLVCDPIQLADPARPFWNILRSGAAADA